MACNVDICYLNDKLVKSWIDRGILKFNIHFKGTGFYKTDYKDKGK